MKVRKVALVHYDVSRIANEPGNKTVMKHFGHMPNIQLLYVAAVLEQLDIEICFIDMIGMDIDDDKLRRKLLSFVPDMICLSIFTSHFHNAMSYARFFKSFLPESKILIGGVHTSIYPLETMEQISEIDYSCVGEAEMVLPEFVRRLRDQESLEGLLGIIWRDGAELQYAGPAPLNMDIDSCPFPARHLIPNHVYFNFISSHRNYTVFNSSRGCPYRCIFCEAGGTKWRARSPANIVAEFKECYEKYNIREIDIFDSSFTINKKRVLELCRLLKETGLNKKIAWNVRSRVNTIDVEVLEALKEGGCYRIFYGIESGDSEILKKLRKEISLERVREIIVQTRKAGISPFGYFLIGAPGETRESARKTIDFAKTLPLDFAIFNCLTAFPKTELYEKYYQPFVENDFWADYIRKPKPVTDFMGRPWTDIPHEELQQIAHGAMLEFYFRPIQILRAVKTVRSVKQLWQYTLAAIDMSFAYLKKMVSKK